MSRKLLTLVFCISILASPPTVQAYLIINGDFETGDFTGWTTGGNNGVVSLANLQLDLSNPALGSLKVTPLKGQFMGAITYPAMEGFVYDNFIYQDALLGEVDKILVLNYFFWTYDEVPFDNPAFSISINGMTVFSLSAGDIGDGVLGTLDFTGWTKLAIPVGQYYDPSRPATIRIALNAGNTGDNQYPSGVFIDNITQYAIPLPSTLLLFATGLVGLARLRKKFKT